MENCSAIARILSRSGLPTNRPNVLIFGASCGGRTYFQKIKSSHDVIGFVDNDTSKHGSLLNNKPIYSAQDIPTLSFDKIIVASCYYQEIIQQLIHEIDVAPDKITVFHSDKRQSYQVRSTIKQFISEKFFGITLSLNNPHIAKIVFSIVQRIDRTYRAVTLTPIHWLDEQQDHIESFLQTASRVDISGPDYIGKTQEIITLTSPAICLSRYQSATFVCTSNSLFHNDRLLMWRSPTSDNRHSDYSSGKIIRHGDKYALVEPFKALEITRGIAITGSIDVNYYHWMLEVLSKFAYALQLEGKYSDFPILISEKAQEIEAVSSFLDQLDIGRKIIYLRSDQYYRVDDLLTITPPNFLVSNLKGKTRYNIGDCYFSSASLQFIRQTALAYAAGQCTHIKISERVFLARKGVFRAYNQSDVWEVLEPKGFDTIYLEDLSFAEQIFIMQHAKVIVGPTGAAWTNLLFCKPNTKALCWMAEEYGDFSCFSHIAAEMQVKMEYLLYKTGSINSRELFYNAYEINALQIDNWLVENQL